MKKVISMILTLVLVLSMSITAFASENTSQTVKGTYTAEGTEKTVYSVDVVWGSMEFTYAVPADVWDGVNHQYVSGGDAKWTCASGANAVTVTNRSNAAVDVAVTTNVTASGITADVANGSFTLGSAAEGATTVTEGKATYGTASITLDGVLTDTAAKKAVIGSVTVTVTDANIVPSTEEEVNAAIEALKNGETVTLFAVSDETHKAVVSAVDGAKDGALISKSVQGLSTTYSVKATFTDAVAAWTDGTTLTMLSNETGLTETIYHSAEDLILDLNGYTLGSVRVLLELESGSLTVCDSRGGGKVDGGLSTLDGTKLYFESGTVNQIFMSGDLIMTGGSVITSDNIAINSAWSDSCIMIAGGEITGTNYSISSFGQIIITGSAKINGNIDSADGMTTITGGTFSHDPTEWVDTENYTVTESGGLWTVTAK